MISWVLEQNSENRLGMVVQICQLRDNSSSDLSVFEEMDLPEVSQASQVLRHHRQVHKKRSTVQTEGDWEYTISSKTRSFQELPKILFRVFPLMLFVWKSSLSHEVLDHCSYQSFPVGSIQYRTSMGFQNSIEFIHCPQVVFDVLYDVSAHDDIYAVLLHQTR